MTALPPAVDTVSFPIEGMTCASCVNRITRYLRNVEGVEEAHVNLAAESATVAFDPTRVDVSELAAAVEAAGYVARIEQAATADQDADVEQAADARPSVTSRRPATFGHCVDGSSSPRC